MTNVTLVAEVTFYPSAQARFPWTQPVRMSLWPAAQPTSAPAEFQIQEPVEASTPHVLRITTLLLPAVAHLMQPGAAIHFGVPPAQVRGEGRILSIEPYAPTTAG